MGGPFERYQDDSFWRRIAMATWRQPRDPSIYASLRVDATALVRVIDEAREAWGMRVTPTHFVGKALAEGVSLHPEVNGILVGGHLYQRETIDVWFNVAFDEGDLFGAKVEDIEHKSIRQVAEELTEGAEAIRADDDERLDDYGRITRWVPNALLKPLLWLVDVLNYRLRVPLTWFGVERDPFGTAMVTNIGTFGLEEAFAPLVPLMRQPAIIVVGEVSERPVAEDGEVVVKPVLPLSVTVDHRYLDGYQAARMADAFQAFLEDEDRLQGALEDT